MNLTNTFFEKFTMPDNLEQESCVIPLEEAQAIPLPPSEPIAPKKRPQTKAEGRSTRKSKLRMKTESKINFWRNELHELQMLDDWSESMAKSRTIRHKDGKFNLK